MISPWGNNYEALLNHDLPKGKYLFPQGEIMTRTNL